jgi:hypothetical protein
MMDGCLGYLVLIGLVAGVVIYIACTIRAANVAAELRREDAELQRTHPEVWRQKELLKLEKERLAAEKELAESRLAAEKELAEGRAKRENLERNVGIGVALCQLFRSW